MTQTKKRGPDNDTEVTRFTTSINGHEVVKYATVKTVENDGSLDSFDAKTMQEVLLTVLNELEKKKKE